MPVQPQKPFDPTPRSRFWCGSCPRETYLVPPPGFIPLQEQPGEVQAPLCSEALCPQLHVFVLSFSMALEVGPTLAECHWPAPSPPIATIARAATSTGPAARSTHPRARPGTQTPAAGSPQSGAGPLKQPVRKGSPGNRRLYRGCSVGDGFCVLGLEYQEIDQSRRAGSVPTLN
jgi:hypothetical protein